MLEKKIFISQQRVICIINKRLVKCDMTMRRTEHFLFVRLIITCWSSAGFTIHVPSSWPRHHHSNRVSLAASIILKERQDKLLGFWWWLSRLQVSRKKKLHVQLVYKGDQFKMWKNVCLLCFSLILVYHTKIKQTTHGSIEQWGNINGTDRQADIEQTSCLSNQSQQIEIHACTSKYVIFSTKKGIGMYKCTRKLQLQQNIFKPCPHFLPALTSS